MASGDLLAFWSAAAMNPTGGSLSARNQIRWGGTTPGEFIPIIAFDRASYEYIDMITQMPPYYSGKGVTVDLFWGCAATTGNVFWQGAFRTMEDNAEDLDSGHTYDWNGGIQQVPGNVNIFRHYKGIVFTDGVDMDNADPNDSFIFRVRRKAPDPTDTADGDSWLWSVALIES